MIRQARPDEAALLTDLAIRSKASNGYDDAFMAACRAELTLDAGSFEERHFEVAETDSGDVVGFFGLWPPVDGAVDIDPFFVAPRLKRTGIGRVMWQALEARARAMGADTILCNADPAAVAFYEAMGMMLVGERPSGSIPGRMLPHLTKKLSGQTGR